MHVWDLCSGGDVFMHVRRLFPKEIDDACPRWWRSSPQLQSWEYPDQLSMVLETGDGGRHDINWRCRSSWAPPVECCGRRELWWSRRWCSCPFFSSCMTMAVKVIPPPTTTTLTRKLQRLNHQQQLQPMLQQSCSSLFPLRRRLARSENPWILFTNFLQLFLL